MPQQLVPVDIRGIFPATNGCALFLGNDSKVFVIDVQPAMGEILEMLIHHAKRERPQTHDLIASIFAGFSIKVESAVITELKNSTFFARLMLNQQNEVSRKLVELDVRPSDCLAIALAQNRPIYITKPLFEKVQDMSEVLERFKSKTVLMETPRWA